MLNLKFGDFTPTKLLHVGQHSCLYEVIDSKTNQTYIVKLKNYPAEKQYSKDFYLEGKVIESMSGSKNIPRLIEQKVEETFAYIVMEKLGPSLAELLNYCNGQFSLKTTLLIFDQMITLIQNLHCKGLVHGNIKPNHFLIGNNLKADTLYLIDFENVANSRERGHQECIGKHFEFNFLSTDALMDKPLSWRDDMQSLAYLLIYFLKGKLPWSSLLELKFPKNTQNISENQLQEIKKAYFKEKRYLPSNIIAADLPSNLISRSRPASRLLQGTWGMGGARLRKDSAEVPHSLQSVLQ